MTRTPRALPLLGLFVAGCVVGPEPEPDDLLAPCDRPGAICTIAGVAGRIGYNGDALPATETWLAYPTSIAWSPDGVLHVADFNNMRIRVLDEAGALVTIAGTGVHGYATDGVPATTSYLENPADVAFLPDGTLLITELHAGRVLTVDAEGTLRVLAGRCDDVACTGFYGDDGPALQALLSEAYGVAADADGRVHVADTENHCLRTVGTDGIIRRLAGDGEPGFSDVGVGRFDRPQRMVVDGDRLLVADAGNHAIREIDLGTGALRTVAGTGVEGFAGDGGPATEAQLDSPWGVDVGPDGSLWIADWGNHRVRRVDPDGVIHTVAGTGEKAFSDDAIPGTQAALAGPSDVLVAPDGAVLLTDMFNGTIRRLVPDEGLYR